MQYAAVANGDILAALQLLKQLASNSLKKSNLHLGLSAASPLLFL
jgi:hypothetical protein